MDAIDALLYSAALDNEEKYKALSRALRQEKNAADIFSMSTIAPLSRTATRRSEQIQEAAKRGGLLREATKRSSERDAQFRLGEEGRNRRNQEMIDYYRGRDAADNETRLLRALVSQGGKGSGLKPTGAERNKYNEARRLRGVISDLEDMRESLGEKVSELDAPWTEAAISFLPDALQRRAEETAFKDEDVRQYRTRVARLESRLSQLASGLAVTGFEMSDRQRWSPHAPGVSDDERKRRIENIKKDLLSEVDVYEQMYPDYKVNEGIKIDNSEPTIAEPEVLLEKPDFVPQSVWQTLTEDEQKRILAGE